MRQKLLSFTTFYHPHSFGGSTIVAEQINSLFSQDKNYDVYVITTLPVTDELKAYQARKYQLNDITIFGIAVPQEDFLNYFNVKTMMFIEKFIEMIKPDIAHFHHCIQGLGVGAIYACKAANIKVAVTLHDFWWLTPSFIFNNGIIPIRSGQDILLRNALTQADILLAPSHFVGDIYKKTLGVTTYLNKNGVSLPKKHHVKHKNLGAVVD